MNFKQWSYWKQGLVSGCIVGILVNVYMLVDMERFFFRYPECSIGSSCPKIFFPELVIVYLCCALIGGTVLGTMLGYLYGKFKNRRKIISS